MRSTRPHFNRPPTLKRSDPVHYYAPRLLIIFALLLFATSNSAQALDLQQYYEQNNGQVFHNKTEFYKQFPYDAYLQSVSFTDFNTLQRDRYFLYTKFDDGDEFLFNLAECFLKLYPVANTVKDLTEKINIGEQYLSPYQSPNKNFKNPRLNDIYMSIGYFILGKVANKISHEIAAKGYDESEQERANIISRLVKDRVYVTREESISSKIAANVKKKNWRYFWDRLHSYVYTYKDDAWRFTVILILLSVLFLILGHWLKFLRGLGILGLAIALVFVFILNHDPPVADSTSTLPASAHTNLKLVPGLKLYPIKDSTDYSVQVYKLLLKDKE